jgi:hypothetical protein
MKYILAVLLIFSAVSVSAQPHIEGTVTLTLKDGLLDCDFALSDLPPLRNYRILLNHGMNIQYFVSDSGKVLPYDGFYSGKMTGEALEYVLMKTDTDTLRPLPQTFRVKYKGAFPVYGDTLNYFDFKGFIAFNGKTARATEQSKWYPVIYDVDADRLIDNYTYRITVNSPDSKTVFLNGSPPQQASPATFQSKTPRALFLFSGNYDYVAAAGNYILNAAVDSGTALKIFRELDRIKAFQTAALGRTYQENIYLIAHRPVKPFSWQSSWGFTIFPSFAYAGVNFKLLLDSTGRMTKDYVGFFSHELAHYYFGDNMVSGPLQWFWLESTAEYLSLKTAAALTDTGYYNATIRNYAAVLKNKAYKPLAQIQKPGEIDDDYRYVYGPLILLSFEKVFGEKRTYQVLSGLVQKAERETLTLTVLKQLALAAKIKEADYDRFYNAYLTSDAAVQNTLQLLARN